MSSLRIQNGSLSALSGKASVTQNGKDAYGRHAFTVGDRIRWLFAFPRALGVFRAVLSLSSDEREDFATYSLTFFSLQGENDIYAVEIDSAFIGVGLYFCRLRLESAFGSIYAYGGNDFHFAQADGYVPPIFQLTLSRFSHEEPAWLYGGVIYHVFVDRFFRAGNAPPSRGTFINPDWENGIPQYPPYPGAPLANNMFFGGDLDGVTEKLSYIASLGTRAIYLSPIFRAASNHKYDTGDYACVDEAFGGERALKRLIAEADKYGIRIILDGVFNHTGADSIYFNRYGNYESIGAYQSKDSPYADWYTFKNFPSEYDAWWGIEILPRLNLKNSACRAYFVGNDGIVSKYASMGIGGMRLDVADELESDFIASIKERLAEKRADAVLYGEVWEDASNKIAYSRRCKYYLGDELDGVMNYPLRTGILRYLREKDPSALAYYFGEVLPNMPKRAADAAMNLLGTHDTLRVLTALGGETPEGKNNDTLSALRMSKTDRRKALSMLKAAYLIAATVPGIPAVYYGDEVGVEGYSDPFNRTPFPWHSIEQELLRHYRRMGEIRKDSLYKDGEFRLLSLTDSFLAFSREDETFSSLTLVNNGKDALRVSLPKDACVLTEQTTFENMLTLAPYDGAVVRISRGSEISIGEL